MFATAVPAPRHIELSPGIGGPSPTGNLSPATLQPRLHHRSWTATTRLSDDGFCDSTAHINLSQELTMGLDSAGLTLSYRGLAELGLGTRQAWDLAADNLVVAARSPQGTRFYLRDAVHSTLIHTDNTALSPTEVKVPGAPVTAWLAHPRTFTILNSHLEQCFKSTLIYLAPRSDLLVVFPADDPSFTELTAWARGVASGQLLQVPGSPTELITALPLVYRCGFPSPAIRPAATPAGHPSAVPRLVS